MCVGGSPALPGAMVLAGTAALRTGAGVVRIGVPSSIALAVGIAVPESLVFGVSMTRAQGFGRRAAGEITEQCVDANAVLIGPGLPQSSTITGLHEMVLPRLADVRAIILDAAALDGAARAIDVVRATGGRTIMTPHAGEMARVLKVGRAEVEANPLAAAREAATRFGAVIVLKGPCTWIVTDNGAAYSYDEGTIGLATAGSGDALTGMIAGLAARGADPLQAAAWGVYLHGTAGNRLREQTGQLGFLARELAAEVPAIMTELAVPRPRVP